MAEEFGEKPKGKLRSGYTTGACAAAASRAACEALLKQELVREVEIMLPIGKKVKFKVHRCEFSNGSAFCSVIKDAGDDPDCTHGAEICSTVSWKEAPGIELDRGEGVGVITKPGLGLEVGGAAINPVPRKMISESVEEVLAGFRETRGVRVVISVPGGEEMAKKTLNARLGILGGISILGTTGIVKPYSTAAFRASVTQSIGVAKALACDHVVLTTGGKSERFAMAVYPGLREEAFIQMGDFLGSALKDCRERGILKATVCGMIGKLSKMAMGKTMTHAAGSQVDMAFLAELAEEAGASMEVAGEIRQANTARHVGEITAREGIHHFFDLLCEKVCVTCRKIVKNDLAVECILTDFDGKILGRFGGAS
jgi:cobalt-precorrin-5B (C1)-methyltransferase